MPGTRSRGAGGAWGGRRRSDDRDWSSDDAQGVLVAGLRGAFERFYFKAQSAIVPALKLPQALYEELLGQIVSPGVTWLELGCGRRLLPPWREENERQLIARAGWIVGL